VLTACKEARRCLREKEGGRERGREGGWSSSGGAFQTQREGERKLRRRGGGGWRERERKLAAEAHFKPRILAVHHRRGADF
jgi:hypothetical protein